MNRLAVCLLLSILGCASPIVGNGMSAPGIIVEDEGPAWAKNKIVAHYTGLGYSIKESSEFSITVARIANDPVSLLMGGTRFGGAPELRIRFTMFKGSDGLHITPTGQLVANPGTGLELSNPLSPGSAALQEAQTFLSSLIY